MAAFAIKAKNGKREGMYATPEDVHGGALRHKWTTVTLTSGVSGHEVSRRLGHRSIKVTVVRSGHVTQDGRERRRQVVGTAVPQLLLTAGRATSEPGADSVPGQQASRHNRPRPYRS